MECMLRISDDNLEVDYVSIPRLDDIRGLVGFITLYGADQVVRVLGHSIFDNKDLMMALVAIDGNYVRYASPRLKNSLELVKRAYDKDPNSIQYVPKSVARDILIY